MDRFFLRGRRRPVRFAVEPAARDARARHQGRVAVRPVVPSVGGIRVARRRDAEARRAPEFADRDDQRLVQQTRLVHIGQQG